MKTYSTKKVVVTILSLLFMLTLIISVSACKKEPTIESIRVEGAEQITISDFSLSNYKLVIEFSDETKKEEILTEEYIVAEDRELLKRVGTHSIRIVYENGTATFTITLLPQEFNHITFSSAEYVYDGTPKKLEVIGAPNGAEIEYDNPTSYTDAGVYVVNATVSKENYVSVTLTATLTINKAVYDMSGVTFDDKTFVYDGTEKELVISGNLPNGVTVSYENNKLTEAGSVNATAKFAGDSKNYEPIADFTATLTINKAVYDMSGVTFDDKTCVYDGTEKELVISGNLPNGVTVSYENNKLTEAGSVNATAKFAGDSKNYEPIADFTAILTINKAVYDMSGVTFDDKTCVYDGTEKELVISGNLPNGVTVSYENNKLTEAGSVNATAKFAGDSKNYEPIADFTAILTINKAVYDMSGVTFDDKTCVYDGTEKELVISGNLPNGVTVSYENNKLTEAGSVNATAKFSGDSKNYEPIADFTAILTINKAVYDMSGVTFDDKTCVYDGTEKELVISGNLPNGVTVSYENNKLTEAGSVNATAKFSGDSKNYEPIADFTAILTVVRDGSYHKVVFVISEQEQKQVVVKHGEGVVQSDIPTISSDRLGYNGVWDKDVSCVTADIEVRIEYTPIEYGITYVCGASGTNNPANPTTYTIESPIITLKNAIGNNIGNTFDGWYTTPNYEPGTRVISLETGNYGDLVLYAKWISYSVEYAEGFDIDYSMQEYELPALVSVVESTKTLMTLSTIIQVSDGCTWELSKDIEGTEPIKTKNVSLKTGHNIYYVTVWYDDVYNLVYIMDIYRLDNFAYLFESEGNVFIEEVRADETTLISKPELEPQKTGYTFVGWFVNGEIVDFPYELKENTVFVAELEVNTYTITYRPNGGNLDMLMQEVTFDMSYTLYDISRTGYTFKGYTYNDEIFESGIWKITQDITIEATWKANTYTITYVPNGGTLDKLTQEVTFDEAYILYDIIRKGYTFTGYYWQDTLIESSGRWQIAEDVTIEATWQINTYTISYLLGNVVVFSQSVEFGSQYTLCEYVDDEYEVVAWIYNGSETSPNTTVTLTEDCDISYTAKSAYVSDEFTYSISGNNAKITGYNGSDTSIVIPDYIKSSSVYYPVTSIGSYAFRGCNSLTSIEIPSGVTSIGDEAFYNCSSLTGVYITDIAAWCAIDFGNSYSNPLFYAHNLYLNGELVTELVIPDSVTSIGSSAFSGCSSLTSIEIPSSVTSIGSYAFSGCSSLTSIEIPSGVTSIGYRAFSGCSSLTAVTFGANSQLKSIGSSAFSGCSSLTGVYITDIAAWCAIDFGNSSSNPLSYAHNLYLNGELVTELVIPDSVTSIGYRAFRGCSSLTSIEIPSSVTSIGDDAFYGCSSLTSIEIPSGVTSIGASAFSGCSSLTSIEIPSGVTSIGYRAFYGCSSLTSIEIPSGVTSIGEYTFYNCSNLMSVTFGENSQLTSIGSSAFAYCSSLTSIEIPSGVTSIGSYAFDGCSSLTAVTFGANSQLTSIGYRAFDGCSSLTSIEIPSGVTSIGSSAFHGCSSLTSIEIPSGVTSIGEYAFSGCSSLTSIEIPSGVTSIGNRAFYDCSSLTIHCEAISKPSGWNSDWNDSRCPVVWDCNNNDVANDGYIYMVVDGIRYALKDGTAIVARQPKSLSGEIIIPESIEYKDVSYSVTSIDSYAFYDCSSLTSIEIPSGVTSIGNRAFAGCSSLTIYCEAISKPSGWNSDWNDSDCPVVWDCNNNDIANDGYIYMVVDGIRYALKDGTAIVARQPKSLSREIIIPESIEYKDVSYSVTSIGYQAFYNCSSLTSIEIPSGVTSIGSYAFYYCSSLTTVTFGENSQLTSIGRSAFSGCSSLTSIEIPSGVTSIGEETFYNCSSLTAVTFGANSQLKSIGYRAFYNCRSLTSIEIPSGVTSIGSYAFDGCSSLTRVYYGGTRNQWAYISIESGNSYLESATRYYYSATEPELNADGTGYIGNYWRYVNGVPTPWEKGIGLKA